MTAATNEMDAIGLGQMVAAGEASASELLEAAIARADAADPALNFMAQRCYDRARARAAAFDAGSFNGGRARPAGPLAGVPFLVKDLHIHIAGVPSGEGSRFLAFKPDFTSTFVERADAAGLMIFGKTTSPELGLTATTESGAHGPTRNPWNPERTPGGSSGGSAVAVAAGVVPMAQASDGGGSVRTPAACCGLFGLKVSRGRLPLGPKRTVGWNGLSVLGPISRSVRDAAAFLDMAAAPEPGARSRPPIPAGGFLADCANDPGRLRVALMPTPLTGAAIDPLVTRALHDAVRLLETLGHHVEEARPPLSAEALAAAMTANLAVCTAADIAEGEARRGRPPHGHEIENFTSMWLHIASQQTGADLQRALATFDEAGVAIDRFLEAYDITLSPTQGSPAIPLGVIDLAQQDVQAWTAAFNAFSPFTALANQTGLPAMTLPLGMSDDGLPIGIMATGRYGEEALLLRLASQVEAAAPWASRRPTPFWRAA